MTISPEQLSKLQEIHSKIQNEHDFHTVSVLIADLIAVLEEKDRQDIARQIA